MSKWKQGTAAELIRDLRPRCLYCGDPLPKRKNVAHFRDEEQAKRGIGSFYWITVPKLPRTMQEVERLVNWRVTRVERLTDGQSDPGGIFVAYGWDGESYAPRYGHFCKIKCAASFGRTMADRGARLT